MNDKTNRFASQCLFFLCTAALLVPNAHATDTPGNEQIQESYRCESGSSFRLFSLNYPDPQLGGGCQVLYEKSDSAEPVRALWRAKYDMQFCVDRMRSSVNKLIDAGWQCDQREAGISDQVAKVTPDLEKPIVIDKVAVSPAANPIAKTGLSTEPKKKVPEYDDWFHRWDELGRRLVFTLSNTLDGSKVRSYTWRHRGLARKAKQPSNIVFIQNQKSRPVLVVVWPAEDSQFITAIDPIRQDKPFCEIESQVKGEQGWGFGIEKDKMILTGWRALPGQPGQTERIQQVCSISGVR